METLIITRKDIEGVLLPVVAISTVERAFMAYGLKQAVMPAKSYLTFSRGDLRSMPAYIHGQGFDIAGIKSVNVHPQNAMHGLPTVMAVIILTDPENGFPLAIMDGTLLTSLRTGAAGALAAKYLSRKTSRIAGFVGCGVQARTQLSCLLEICDIRQIKIWQFNGEEKITQQFKAWAEETYHLAAAISSDIDEITGEVDILVTTTPSRIPLVNLVSPGTHINAIGADAPGKQEISPSIIKQARVVVDDWTQASHSGEINVPLHTRQILKKDVYASLGDIVAGKKRGRLSDVEITLFDATGLAIEDVSCAYAVYEALKDKPGIKSVQFF